MLAALLDVVAPIVALIAVGWLFAGRKSIDLPSITEIVLLISAPALVFSGLVSKAPELARVAQIGLAVLAQFAVSGALTALVFKATGKGSRGLALAAIFPNTGNLGLPLGYFAFGDEGLAIAIVIYSTVNLVHYSLGLLIVSGSTDLRKPLKMPLMWAAAGGLACSAAGWTPPKPIFDSLELLGQAAVPLMLFSLGYRMRSVSLDRVARPLMAVALRIIPGFATAWAWVHFSGAEGAVAGMILLLGVLPPAVMNFVLAERYSDDADDVAAAIFIGTLISLAAIPLVLSNL